MSNPMQPARGNWEIGHIDGRYSLIEHLGVGGMGAVYLAIDEKDSKLVALKTILPNFIGDATAIHRFVNEIRTMETVNSPNVVRILGSGTYFDHAVGATAPYLCMEYIKGRTLRDKVSQDWGRLPQREAARIIAEVCRGIFDLHQAGFVHRDVKPQNVLINSLLAESVQVSDLGLAFGDEDRIRNLTPRGPVGTYLYIAPELWRNPRSTSPRSDIFSAGCILYELLVGKPAFSDERGASDREPPPPAPKTLFPHLSTSLSDLAMKMMSAAPHDRPENPMEVVEEVERLMQTGELFQPELKHAKWPKLSDAIHRPLAHLAGFSFGVPVEWCRGASGNLLGLARRSQISQELHESAANAIDGLLNLAKRFPSANSSDLELLEFRRSMNDVFQALHDTIVPIRKQTDGFDRVNNSIDSSLQAFRDAVMQLVAGTDQGLGGAAIGWNARYSILRGSIRQLVSFEQEAVRDQCFVVDRLLAALVPQLDENGTSGSGLAIGAPPPTDDHNGPKAVDPDQSTSRPSRTEKAIDGMAKTKSG